ncbi:MAG TPA: methyltransferase domain-containing protein, partial [Polyangiaceae bacterium]
MSSPLASPVSWDLVAREYAKVTAPFFANYANAALELAQVQAGSRLLDIAAGPGTLSLLAAQRGCKVTAIDFAPNMIEELKAEANSRGVHVDTIVGDGQALPLDSHQFDAAFSMFGLIFFPERAKGFKEMHRTLAPGGVGLVASWQPMERFAMLADVFGALRSLLPNLPFGDGKAPLGEPSEIVGEMTAAGFESVRVEEVSASAEAPNLDQAWSFLSRGSAPFALVRRGIGETAWQGVEQGIVARLREKYGSGAQTLT